MDKITFWDAGKKTGLNPNLSPELQEAARQRQELIDVQKEWEKKRAEEEKKKRQ